jgi:signal transduction histidine kinase
MMQMRITATRSTLFHRPVEVAQPLMDAPRHDDRPQQTPQVGDALLACFQRALGHELPSRLVALQGLLRVLEMEVPDDLNPEAREYLTRAADLARRAHALMRELADLGRATRNPPGGQPIRVGEAAREAIAETNQLARGRAVAYHVYPVTDSLNVPWPGLPHVLARLFRHIVQAGSADPERTETPLRIEVDGRETLRGIEVCVGSNAPAPPVDQLGRLFDPFLATPGATTAPELGLFPVRLLVESWGGSVRASAATGLTFTLITPRADE